MMKVLNTDSFMVAFGSNVQIDIQKEAYFFSNTFEGATVIGNNNAEESNLYENILDK
jgi:hypothetical protein